MRATVRLWTEDAGHRVPTGFIDRQLILVVEGEDAAGKPVAARAGPRLPSAVGKELEGQAGKLYAKLLHDFDGHSPAPFWRADPEAVDTRLAPDQHGRDGVRFSSASGAGPRPGAVPALLGGDGSRQGMARCGRFRAATGRFGSVTVDTKGGSTDKPRFSPGVCFIPGHQFKSIALFVR